MKNNLDGITLLRYAHIYRHRTSGGVEQYLRQLNYGLLARHRMTILQTHLVTGDGGSLTLEVETHGLGRIIWIPIRAQHDTRSAFSLVRRLRHLAPRPLTANSEDNRFGVTAVYPTIRASLSNSWRHLRYPTMILSDVLTRLLDAYSVDLILLHWLSYDVGTLVSCAVEKRIPFAIINHFDNSRLVFEKTQRWTGMAAAMAGVSNKNVPPAMGSRYVNLSDAVDSEFFSLNEREPARRSGEAVVLLPGRITPGKGHEDLLLAARTLAATGVHPSVVFAGAVESDSFRAELERKASRWGLRERVRFLGQLTSEELRQWYQSSDVIVLPSTSEGLSRVLLEAQAMQKPVVAYDCGGTAEAMVPNKTGFLVPMGNYAALANRLKYLLDNPETRTVMGAAGRTFVVQHFSVAALVERHEHFCSEVLSRYTA